MSDPRDDLAALTDIINRVTFVGHSVAEDAAYEVLARWRLTGRFKCWYKTSHGDYTDPTDTCCGQPVIPWKEESVR